MFILKSTISQKLLVLLSLPLLSGCATLILPEVEAPKLSPRTSTFLDLRALPLPSGKIVASVYNFRDQTGQYKPSPASSFSTSVTQGGTAMLTQALNDSGWFITLEREGLQNLLTERKIIRASQKKANVPTNNVSELPSLLAANVLIEGAIVAYDTNIKTGGSGARYLGIGVSEQYRVDQVTVNLRAVNVRTGRILNNVSASKTILSKELKSGLFKFIEFKELLELEVGIASNEPTQICVMAAVEAAVIHMIVDGLDSNTWSLENKSDINHPLLKRYRDEEPVILGVTTMNFNLENEGSIS